jgi:hypothetical protein
VDSLRSFGTGFARGVIAGVAGTAAMTAYQLAVAKVQGRPLGTKVPRTWAEAPAPAQVAKRVADRLGKGRRLTKKDVPWLTNAMHWAYGVSWGAAYGVAATATGARALPGGLVFGTGVCASSYAELVPLGIYDAPWEYPPQELALDLSYHLVYGVAVAATYAALDR